MIYEGDVLNVGWLIHTIPFSDMAIKFSDIFWIISSLGVTGLDKFINQYICGIAHVGRFGCKLREARLRWLVQRRAEKYV